MQKNKIKDLTLVLDSSSTPLLLSLKAGDKIYTAQKDGIKQEEILFPLINKLYKKIGADFKDTKNFFFVKGPGRFTGVRIGITLASILAEICNTNIASANLFDILGQYLPKTQEYITWKGKNKNGIAVIVLHAFRQEYFAQFLEPKALPKWVSFEDLQVELAKQKKPLFLVGWAEDKKPLKKYFSANYTFAKDNFITAEKLFFSAINASKKKQTREEILTPLYLKPARFELCKK